MIPAIMLTISALFAAIPQPAPAWRTGMLAIDAGTGETILESRSDELFRPASTVKLITTLLAFRTLGPSRIILTHVVADHAAGAVYLIGSGAPLIEPDDIERAAVEASAELGGGSWRLFFDTSVFADSNRCPGWEQADWARVYCPPVEALTLGDNVLELVISSRGGAVTVEEYPELPGLQLRGSVNIRAGGEPTARPEGWETASPVIVLGGAIPPDSTVIVYVPFAGAPRQFSEVFAAELESRGVGVSSIGRGRPSSGAVLDTVAVIRSRPLSELAAQMNKWSMNVVAELILRVAAGDPETGVATTAAGCEMAGRMLAELHGVEGTQLADGSGLSRLNRIAPAQLVSVLLEGIGSLEWGPEFVSSLAVNGVDGTMATRLADLPPGAFRGKTGSLNDTATLAGMIYTAGGRSIAMAVLCEVPQGSVYAARNWQDALVRQLYSCY
ncbi:MAG TPA: D-alanyl-D-alanine carboxypeptidase/D-alanyl-D-alanine-endopeptidase [Candidatus Fermentibacter daniensis]|nr:D-alanyl-D-alanine carboxypeptidase/D-alanyl-D-alanine-endopeptidase [Candidatus Fermentibacter sp.]NLI03280.1 D-alanyl-D-alanine carboxypeptidase/D-alanyl-D-alanine-endopeptidase [Candidatus Fermentibacter daniensis]MCC6870992.1 D-alanyl-D-alanine carboxypeptidase/D-alanyl-D-alanine-endopeptidase [Candidatus Fermentibacter sp.]HOD19969.1 D-alanyl-D-alanine carboxypeptidase/D-alanyl-D-alanine-endopeptidase [Candidatus Fermentibacter daniensis]HOG55595.1 D-alanyl-D-alanine carboxypeptidase/D-